MMKGNKEGLLFLDDAGEAHYLKWDQVADLFFATSQGGRITRVAVREVGGEDAMTWYVKGTVKDLEQLLDEVNG